MQQRDIKRFNNWKHLALHLFSLMVLYGICRWIFYYINKNAFPELSFTNIFFYSWHGLRFDWSTICSINILFIALYLFPIKQKFNSAYNSIIKYLFVVFNYVALLFEISDWIYFKYNKQRANAEILKIIQQPSDFLNLLPTFFKQYWYIFLLAIILFVALVKLYNRIENIKIPIKYSLKYVHQFLIWIFSLGISILGIRGGFQYIPINIRDAILVANNNTTPLVLNTPFSIIGTFQNDAIQSFDFMDDNVAINLAQPIKKYHTNNHFINKNICIIILESFSKEFTKLSNNQSYTPFLDELMDKSIVFENAYANALHSAQGIPSIVAGIPGILPQAFSMSPYANNTINSFASLLKPLNYSSAFFHGATNGSFSFDILAKNAGYDYYFGRKEYNNENDYDGTWGIWDEPFLQFAGKKISSLKQPFVTTIFTINSHNPYTIPNQYESIIPKTTFPIQRAIQYTDLALRKFFETVEHTEWYNNTIFVITADHTSAVGSSSFYQDQLGKYQIPILFFDPSQQLIPASKSPILMQQIDIMPSILHKLQYPYSFYALGNSVYDTAADRFILAKQGTDYTFIHQNTRLQIADNIPYAAFAFPNDSTDQKNIIQIKENKSQKQALEKYQAIMQVFSNDLRKNNMFAPN